MAKTKPINLLPQEEFEASTLGRILHWAMGTFRIIVIVTEIIVMAAFLSRFWLDAQNSDLNDAIKVKSAEVSAQSEFEKEFRGLQNKLNIFKSISQSSRPSDRLDSITSKLPGDVSLSSFASEEGGVQIKGLAGSEIGLAQLLSNLKSETSFKSVELGSVNSAENNPAETIFTIKISY